MGDDTRPEEITAYWDNGLMPQLFLWLSPEMQRERAQYLAGLGDRGPDPRYAGPWLEGSVQPADEEGGGAGGDEGAGGHAPENYRAEDGTGYQTHQDLG